MKRILKYLGIAAISSLITLVMGAMMLGVSINPDIDKQEQVNQTILGKPDKVIYFTADWCAPCKKVGPLVKKSAKELGLELTLIDVSYTEVFDEYKNKYPVSSLPTVLVIRGKDTMSIVGYNEEDKWSKILN